MAVIHILIVMFNSNPMTPLSVFASMGLRLRSSFASTAPVFVTIL